MLGADPDSMPVEQVAEPIPYRCPVRVGIGGQHGEGHCRRDPILVTNSRADRVAKGLFVAEHEVAPSLRFEIEGGIPDPLEAGEGSVVDGSVVVSDRTEHRGGDDAVDDDRRLLLSVAEDELGEQSPDLVPCELAIPTIGLGK